MGSALNKYYFSNRFRLYCIGKALSHHIILFHAQIKGKNIKTYTTVVTEVISGWYTIIRKFYFLGIYCIFQQNHVSLILLFLMKNEFPFYLYPNHCPANVLTFYQVIKGRILKKKKQRRKRGFHFQNNQVWELFQSTLRIWCGILLCVLYSREDKLFSSAAARACIIKLKSFHV